jgi:eukaryotic-like serine/threonine-protein kinase
MDGARWERVQAVFHAVADLPPEERHARLDAECAGDEALRAEVLGLLEEDARGGSVLDRGVARIAHEMLTDSVPPALLAQCFGPYRIREVLGEGGMGVVYLAEREDLGSLAAIKILRDAWLSAARRERFAAEQRTLAQLSHPSIARLFDADTLADGTPWFVMEYVEGAPLTAWCERHGATIPERLRLFRAVCEAVDHAHRHLVVHRDLKPSNILVTEDGGVKLLDFGIAKQLESLDGPVDQTRTGLRLMTPAYAAPEQIRGGPVSIQTDVYALGVILYELLTGRLPFDLSRRTPAEAEAAVLDQEPERPALAARRAGVAPSVSRAGWADLDVLCLAAMRKDPARRYRNVAALIADVDHFLEGEPLDARPDTLGYRVGKYVRRNRRGVTAAAAMLTAVVGLVGFYTVRLARARNLAVAEAARSQRIQQFMGHLFKGGDEEAGPADSLRVITLVHRGVQQARNLVAEPVVQAELYEMLGGILQQLGELEGADSLLRAGLSRRQALFGEDHAEVARSLVSLGLLRADQARLPEAEQLVRQGLVMARQRLKAAHPQVAEASTALGYVLEKRGDYDAAIKVHEEVVGMRSAAGDTTPELAASLYALANNHFYAGHYPVSDSLNHRVMAMNRAMFGERHPSVAENLVNLGATQFEQGHYTEAERLYREALAITQGWYGPDHPETAAGVTMVGRALVRQEKLAEAAPLLEQALAIRERVFGRVHPSVASTLNEVATIAMLRGDYDEAERGYRRMVDIYQTIYPGLHYQIGIAKSNLGSVLTRRNDHVNAEKRFREAIAIFLATLPADHSTTGIARIKLGRALLRQRRFAEAATESFAGYEILIKQADPGISFLINARKDLVEAYTALAQPEKGARFRQELAALDAAKATPPAPSAPTK